MNNTMYNDIATTLSTFTKGEAVQIIQAAIRATLKCNKQEDTYPCTIGMCANAVDKHGLDMFELIPFVNTFDRLYVTQYESHPIRLTADRQCIQDRILNALQVLKGDIS